MKLGKRGAEVLEDTGKGKNLRNVGDGARRSGDGKTWCLGKKFVLAEDYLALNITNEKLQQSIVDLKDKIKCKEKAYKEEKVSHHASRRASEKAIHELEMTLGKEKVKMEFVRKQAVAVIEEKIHRISALEEEVHRAKASQHGLQEELKEANQNLKENKQMMQDLKTKEDRMYEENAHQEFEEGEVGGHEDFGMLEMKQLKDAKLVLEAKLQIAEENFGAQLRFVEGLNFAAEKKSKGLEAKLNEVTSRRDEDVHRRRQFQAKNIALNSDLMESQRKLRELERKLRESDRQVRRAERFASEFRRSH